VTGLSGEDRRVIERAREIAGVRTGALRKFTGEDELALAYAVAFARAQWELRELLLVVERIVEGGQAAEDTRRLGEIRALLAGFDWEHDDRQYALEAIERIAGGSDSGGFLP
jgi:hypothetical protein